MTLSPQTQVLKGDIRKLLSELIRDEEYHRRFRAIITSPPYFQCRNYGANSKEIGREKTPLEYLLKLAHVFTVCKELLSKDGTLWIVISDVRENGAKLNLPHKLAGLLVDSGYYFQADVQWYKRNHVSGSSKQNFTSAYESILVFSKSPECSISKQIKKIDGVWDVPTKAHSGQEHFAIYPEELVEKILSVATKPRDYVLDTFAGRGTTGIACARTNRRFVGIDLYANHVKAANRNIENLKEESY